MKLIVSIWFVYGIFYLDSTIYTELYLTNHCERAYNEIIKEQGLEIKSSDYLRNYVGYGCHDTGDS